jgi:hypothetical protein
VNLLPRDPFTQRVQLGNSEIHTTGEIIPAVHQLPLQY